MNRVLVEDIKDFVSSFVLAEELHNATFLVTGGTGLIGSLLIRCLLALNKSIHVIAPVRNRVKAEALYTEYASNVKILECDLLTFDYDTVGDVDYIFRESCGGNISLYCTGNDDSAGIRKKA